ncbi:MAG: hypothetical protein ACKV2U_03305 [Bryobacteraceae bacterium]
MNLRDGDIEWKDSRKAFKEIGYTGYATVKFAKRAGAWKYGE